MGVNLVLSEQLVNLLDLSNWSWISCRACVPDKLRLKVIVEGLEHRYHLSDLLLPLFHFHESLFTQECIVHDLNLAIVPLLGLVHVESVDAVIQVLHLLDHSDLVEKPLLDDLQLASRVEVLVLDRFLLPLRQLSLLLLPGWVETYLLVLFYDLLLDLVGKLNLGQDVPKLAENDVRRQRQLDTECAVKEDHHLPAPQVPFPEVACELTVLDGQVLDTCAESGHVLFFHALIQQELDEV